MAICRPLERGCQSELQHWQVRGAEVPAAAKFATALQVIGSAWQRHCSTAAAACKARVQGQCTTPPFAASNTGTDQAALQATDKRMYCANPADKTPADSCFCVCFSAGPDDSGKGQMAQILSETLTVADSKNKTVGVASALGNALASMTGTAAEALTNQTIEAINDMALDVSCSAATDTAASESGCAR